MTGNFNLGKGTENIKESNDQRPIKTPKRFI